MRQALLIVTFILKHKKIQYHLVMNLLWLLGCMENIYFFLDMIRVNCMIYFLMNP